MGAAQSIKRRLFGPWSDGIRQEPDSQGPGCDESRTQVPGATSERQLVPRAPIALDTQPLCHAPDANLDNVAVLSPESPEAPLLVYEYRLKLLECLRPVDWASVETLERLTGLPVGTVIRELYELESQGKVGIGAKSVPPEVKTAAWLVDEPGGNGSRP